MAQAKTGDRVKISFTGRLADGEIFDSTEECHSDGCGCGAGPLEFVIGDDEIIAGLNDAVIGMQPGEKKTVLIPAEQGYGNFDEDLVMVIERSDLPEDLKPEVGDTLGITDEDDEEYPVTVVEVTDTTVSLDANHPLAGEELSIELELLEIL